MLRRRNILTLLFLAILTALPLTGSAAWRAQPLKVGFSECMPFVQRQSNGAYTGYTVELFGRVTSEMEVTYEIKPYPWNKFLEAAENGEFDLGVSCAGITYERERVMDFSHAFYVTNLTAAVREADPLQSLRGILFSWNALAAIVSLALLSGAIGLIIWIFEHKSNPGIYPLKGRLERILDVYLSGVLYIFGDGINYNLCKTISGRIIATIGRVANTVFITSLIAVVAGTVTSAMLSGQINDPQDLHRVRSGVLLETLAEKYAIENKLNYSTYITVEEMLDDLASGKIDAALQDEPVLQYSIKQGGKTGKYAHLTVLPWRLETVKFGFVMPEGSPLRESFNRALLKVLEKPDWRDYEDAYFKK